MSKLIEYKNQHDLRCIYEKEFKQDAKEAVIEWWKVKSPNTWFLNFISVELYALGWFYQLRCCPFFKGKDHWFFKKWNVSGNSYDGFIARKCGFESLYFVP